MTHDSNSTGGQRWETALPNRYPDPDVIALDPRFERLMLGHAAIERIATGCRFTEGPVWFGDLRRFCRKAGSRFRHQDDKPLNF
jgi:hypothetical protein